jgi:integrase
VLPELGGTQLRDVRPQQLNLLYARLQASGRRGAHPGGPLSPRTVRYVHTIVHRVFRDAERWGLVPGNPARFALPGRANASGRREQTTWTVEDVRAFLAASRSHRGRGHEVGDRMYGGWVLLITTGLRRGELLGLRWADIDFDRKLFSVRQTAVLEYHNGRRTVVFGKPKTNSGRRVVALDAGTIAILREHRIQLLEERLAAGEAWEEHDLVMPNRDGRPFDPEYFSREFRSRLQRYGVPDIRLHDLRHTHATLALEAGVHPKVVSERLGHSGVAITLDLYSHVSVHMQSEAAELVAGPLLLAAEGPLA